MPGDVEAANDSERPPELHIEQADDLPEFYIDGYEFTGTPFTAELTFSITLGANRRRRLAIVRMSPVHAKTMAILLKRNLHQYEERMGLEIPIPAQLLEALAIDLERDWE